MQGGTLAAGARAAISDLDRHLEEALTWDYFLRTYGRTPKELEEVSPYWMMECFGIIGAVRAEIQQEAQADD